jgi:probable selenium-dependent hydroxylase accessory protein YqeC
MGLLCDTLQLYGGGVVSLVGAGGKTTLMFQLARELAAEGQSVLTTTTTKISRPTSDQSRHVVLGEDLRALLRKLGKLTSGELHVTAGSRELVGQSKLIGYAPDQINAARNFGLFRWILVEADGARRCPLKVPGAHEPVIPASSGWVIAMVGLDAIGKPLDDQHVFRAQDYARLTCTPIGSPVTAKSVIRAILPPQGILKGSPLRSKRIVFLNRAEDRDRRAAGREIGRSLRERGNGVIDRLVIGSLVPKPLMIEVCDLHSDRF